MKKTELGKSGINVSALGVGCWQFGGGAYWGDVPQSEADNIVAAALENGINYFDTAEVYNNGGSESALGRALSGRRDKAVIGSKLSTSNIGEIEAHLDASLKRLGTDYIDIYMLHWPVNRVSVAHFNKDADINALPDNEKIFRIFEKLRMDGKIRAAGISNHGVKQMDELRRLGADIAVNEIAYNLISRAAEREILPYCKTNGIGVFGYMAYQQGILTGKYNSIAEIPEPQAHSRHFAQSRGGSQSRHHEDGAEAEIEALMDIMRRLSDELRTPAGHLALSWAMSNDMINTTLAGVRNIRQLEDNIRAAEYMMPADVKAELDEISMPVWNKLGDSADYYENRENSRTE